jgi:hypothetical protein
MTGVVFKAKVDAAAELTDAVIRAASRSCAIRRGLRIRGEASTISTVGLLPGDRAVYEARGATVIHGLILSLTSAIDSKAHGLIPLAKTYPVADLRARLRPRRLATAGQCTGRWLMAGSTRAGRSAAIAALFRTSVRVHVIDVKRPVGPSSSSGRRRAGRASSTR